MSKSPAWTRKEGKSESGGLNEKGRASLRAQGHDIKRPQPEGGSRRDSFCARMKGMKEKLTSSETASDPDSRINKSLRKWNCASGGEVWDKARPKDLGKPEKLSPSEKKSAKAAAKAAGRPYPNLVDNMRAARADGGTVGRAGQLLARAKGYATGGNPTADDYIGPSRYHENFGSDVADNVGQVYRYFSGRDPDAAGLGFWTQGIGGGKASYDDLAYSLARSPESTINQLYQIYSGRDVDPAGRQFWSDAINSGRATFDTLADALEQSPEGQRYLIQEARNRSRDTATDAGSPGTAGTVQFASPDRSWYQKARPVPNSSEELVKFFAPIEKQYNLPAGSLLGMMGNESTYGANQHRKGSDFKGAFQMSSDLTKRFEVSNPYDWQEQAVAAAKYMAENRDFFIKKTGREPLPHEYYNMHQQGPNGYAAIAKHPNIPAVDALVMEGVYKPAAALKAIRNNMPPSQKGKADARHILASDFSGGWGVDFNRKMNGPDGQGVTMIANYGQTPTVASDKPVTQPPTVAPGTGPFGGYASLNEFLNSLAPPPPPPPANYQEAVAKYKQDYANWEDSVRRWQIADASMNNGKVGPVPASILNNRPTPPNPADWGNPSGGEYRPEPPPPTSQLQPINQGAGTQVNPQINYPSPPPVTNPSPTPMPGTTGQTFVPQGTPTQVNWAPMQNMIAGSQLASQFAGANTGYGGPGIAAPSGLPSYGGMSTPAVTGGVSFMRKAGGRVGRADGGHLDRLMARISEKTVEDQKKKYDTGPKEGEPVLTQGPEPTFWDKIKDRMMGDRPSPERRQFVEGLGNIADVGHMGAYATPLAPYVGAADFAHGLASGDRLETLMSAAGLPGRGAKMAGAAASAMMPEGAEAGPLGKALQAIRAYHGTPHKFDRFDISKIGTGEGAQAYGHGLYFAQSEPVAKSYRDSLSQGTMVRPTGEVFSPMNELGHLNVRVATDRYGLDAGIKRAEQLLAQASPDRPHRTQQALLNDYNKLLELRGNAVPNPGHMYEVDLHTNPENLLDYDKPIFGQPAYSKVRKYWDERFGDPDIIEERLEIHPGTTGGGFYSTLMGANNQAPEATGHLLEAGVPGIRYLDSGSRGVGSGTSNYVVFDPNIIEILSRYKKGGAVEGRVEAASGGAMTKFLRELAERYRPHYDPSARVLGQPRKEWLSSVKLSRPLEEMSVVKSNPREMLPENFITPSDLEGKALITGLGDRTPAGYEVTAINGRKLRLPVNMMGGPGFARDVAAQGPDRSVWASGLSRAQALANRARAAQEKGLDPIFTYVAQGPESGDFSHHMLDAVLGQLDRRKMDPELAGRIDRRMREAQTASGETFAPKPDWVGISSPEAAARMRERADERGKLIKEMDAAAYRDAPGFADIGAARFATTDPNFMFDPGFSAGKSFMRMTPGEVVKQPAIAHPSYDTHLPAPGEGPGYIGRLEYELPPELHYKKYREEEIKPELRGKPLSKQTMSILKQVPTVEATPEWVDMASEWQDIMRRQYGSRKP